jgi:hypothetical protein
LAGGFISRTSIGYFWSGFTIGFRRSGEPRHRSARDRRSLASGRLSLLLALEITLSRRAAADQRGAARLDRRISIENPLWGAPRIHGELLKLGFEVAQSSVAKYMVKRCGPASQGWRTFLRNQHIVTFFGIAVARTSAERTMAKLSPAPDHFAAAEPVLEGEVLDKDDKRGWQQEPMPPLPDIEAVINRALRAAGLIKG